VAAEAVGYAIEFRAGTAVEEVVTETPRGKVSDGFGGAGGGMVNRRSDEQRKKSLGALEKK